MNIDPKLKQWATERQAEILDAVVEHGGIRAAARALDLRHANVQKAIAAVKARAAKQGYSPDHDMTRTVPDGFKLKGVSTYYNKDGKATGQWVKSAEDRERQVELMRMAVAAMCADVKPVAPVAAPAVVAPDLCNLYVFTDYHLGMLAWARETGEAWDLGIAEDTLARVFGRLLAASPNAGTAVVAQLGDFLHADGLAPVTPTSGHVLDADGRFPKVVEVAIRMIRRLVSDALAQHDRVVLLNAEGNHDMASSVWLRALFSALYENEPRVEVITNPAPYYVHQHGDTMLAFHHGHLSKNDALPLLFAATHPQTWGATQHRYAHTGHRHHQEVKEHSGMTVEQHTTLSARDAYAARGGWVNDRGAVAVTYHARHGEVGRVTVRPEMVTSA